MKEFLKKNNIKTNNLDIYFEAFTHSSYINEHKTNKTYERLEFLGDSILSQYVSNYLFNKVPLLNEGKMSIIRSFVVKADSLAKFSKQIGLDKLLRIGNYPELRENKKILSDLFESLVAALYIDNQDMALFSIFEKTVYKLIDEKIGEELKDAKTLIQEYLQRDKNSLIQYNVKVKNKIFHAKLKHDTNILGEGKGSTKKEAEINAAKDALKKLNVGD
ncbi:MAG: ribonuclease III [Mycoplasma sp.]|nr:ribonuclease III [Mycoplasma sp.]